MANYIDKIYMQVSRLGIDESTIIDPYDKPYPIIKATVSNLSKREKRLFKLTTNNGIYRVTRLDNSARPEVPYSQFVRSQVEPLSVGDVTIADIGDKPLGWFRAVLTQVSKSMKKRFKTRMESGMLIIERVQYVERPSNAMQYIKAQVWELGVGGSLRIDTSVYSLKQCQSAVYNINKQSNRRFKLVLVDGNPFISRRGDKK